MIKLLFNIIIKNIIIPTRTSPTYNILGTSIHHYNNFIFILLKI